MPDNRQDPEVIRSLREYRAALILREDEQTIRLAKNWIEIEKSLQNEMIALGLQIQEEQAKGNAITEQLLRRMDRYKSLNAQMKDEILKYSKDVAVPDISNEQLEFGKLAIQSASEAIRLTGGLGVQFDRLPNDAIETYVGYLGDGTPLNRLLKEAYPDSLDAVVKSFLDGAAKGLNPLQIAYNASVEMGAGLERITLIARTEQLRVSRNVSSQQYRESGLNGVMRRVATKDSAVCMACLLLDGQIIPLDEELDDHPRGRCIAVFQIKGSKEIQWEKGQSWFERQDENLQKEMMGQEKFELWKAGAFELSDMAQIQKNDTWGDSPRVATIDELLNGKDKSQFISVPPNEPEPAAPTPSLNEFEDNIVNQKFETAALYSQTGEFIYEQDGTKRQVRFTNEQIKQMENGVLTHNHPNGSSFSVDDIVMLYYAKLNEIRAVGSSFTYSMINNGSVNLAPKIVKREYKKAFKQALNELVDPTTRTVNPYHRTWEIFAEKHNLIYTRK